MTGGSNEEGERKLLGRRRYLQMVGAATSASALATFGSDTARAAVEYRGIQFERVVNLVDDYGADPTGSEPVDDAIKAAADADTLIKVPDGDYLFSGEVFLSPDGNLGFLAEDGASPRFVAPDGHNDNLLNCYHFPKALFEGIDIDIRAPDTTGGLRFDIDDRFHVQDVEFLGRGTHPDSNVARALLLTVTNSSGVGIVRNVVAKKGSAIGHYKNGDGRTGAYVGGGTKGTVRFEDCHFEEFGNNGLYCGRTPGDVQVIGGTYRNNNVAGVRIAGEGSYVKDALVEVDLDKYTGPDTLQDSAYNTRCIVIDSGSTDKTPGALVKNCDVRIENADSSNGAICVQDWSETNPQELYIEDTTVTLNDDFPAIYSEGGPVHASSTTIKGSASGGRTIHFNGSLADGSSLSQVCTEQTGSGRDGVVADGASCSVDDSNINVTADELVEQNGGSISASNVTFDESCSSTSTSSNSAPTVDSLTASEVETDDGDAAFDVDWQVSDSDDNLASVDLTLTDDTDGETEDTVSVSSSGGTASDTTRLIAAGDDGSGNSYTVDLVVTDADGATDSATASVSETEDTTTTGSLQYEDDAVAVHKSHYDTYDRAGVKFSVTNVADQELTVTHMTITPNDTSINELHDESDDVGRWVSEVHVDADTQTGVCDVSGSSALPTTVDLANDGWKDAADAVAVLSAGSTASAALSRFEADGTPVDMVGKQVDVDVDYELADGSTGTDAFTLSINSAPTVDSLTAAEVETSDGDAEFDVDWQVSDTDSNLASVDLTLTDDADGTTEDTATIDISGGSADGITRLVAAGDDGLSHTYTVDLVVTDGEGLTTSATISVAEDEPNSAPSIDSYTVTEAGSPNPHAEITADWSVADEDGNLDTATVEVFDSSGTRVASASTAVSGSSASGTDEFEIKHVAGETFDVTLTVTDSQGSTASATQTVTE